MAEQPTGMEPSSHPVKIATAHCTPLVGLVLETETQKTPGLPNRRGKAVIFITHIPRRPSQTPLGRSYTTQTDRGAGEQ